MSVILRHRKIKQSLLIIAVLFSAVFVSRPQPAEAVVVNCPACTMCTFVDCAAGAAELSTQQSIGETVLLINSAAEWAIHHFWMINEFFKNNVLRAMMMMTEQLTAVGYQQLFIIGQYLDAKHQLETQRLFQVMMLEEHRDFQPSEDFCVFGTNTRSIAPSEQIGRFNKQALAKRQMDRQLGKQYAPGSYSRDQDKQARWERFVNRYCDPKDNTWLAPGDEPQSGLRLACFGTGGGQTPLVNIDIDYTRLIDEPRSLNIAFHEQNLADEFVLEPPGNTDRPEPNEQDIIALGNNLYGHNVLTREVDSEYLKNKQNQQLYMELRTVAAKRSVAENSYNSIVGMKAYGSAFEPEKEYSPTIPGENVPPGTERFLAHIMKDLGLDKEEIWRMIGLQPSYYAQLEILAKRLYQSPNFYANLYDTPANVARRAVALKAIELMVDREIYESQIRREMAFSVLLSTKLQERAKRTRNILSAGAEN